jgi:hypothetical protein
LGALCGFAAFIFGAPFKHASPLLDVDTAPAYSNVIYSRAEFDPNRGWSPATHPSTGKVWAVWMANAGHTLDMINRGKNVSIEMQRVWLQIIQQWI